MRYAYQPSFLDTSRHLSRAQASKLLKAIEKFQSAMAHHHWPKGFGLTDHRAYCIEFRSDIQVRVI